MKQEKLNLTKENPEEKIETQSTEPDLGSQDPNDKYAGKIENDNDVWKMLHGDVDPNSPNFSYELSFEINPHAKVPDEIKEFGRYIENRAKELVALYEKTGRRKEIAQLKENLKQAMSTQKRLENISKLDFNRPGPKLRETALKLNLDLNDPGLKADLQKMQEQNLEDVRKWLKAEKTTHPQLTQNESRYEKIRSRKSGKGSAKAAPGSTSTTTSNVTTTINNYFINNNYFGGPGLFSKFFSSSNNDLITSVRTTTQQNKSVSAKSKDSFTFSGTTIAKYTFYCLIFLFFAYLVFLDQEKQFKREPEMPNLEGKIGSLGEE